MSYIECLTVDDFKKLFTRNFPYLPFWDDTKTYFAGDIVYSGSNFYESLVDNNKAELDDDSKWQLANISTDEYVSDSDIERAWAEAMTSYNDALCKDKYEAKIIFLYLVAFYLAYDLSLASGGAFGQVTYPATQVSVGSVSESYYVPERFINDPVLGFYTKNGFGLKYLNMIYPRIIGGVRVVTGWTLP